MSPSAPTALVADSTSYVPREILAEHDVHLVSLYVGLEGEQQRELEIQDLGAFYERLKFSKEMVTTSQPSVGDFLEVYEPLLEEGREIVSIHMSSGISGTYESAIQARERLTTEGKGGERIHVSDSRTGGGGMGMIILAVANAIEAGASGEEAKTKADEARDHQKIWFAVDTLEYLRRGGRIGAARALIGSTLKIKPILTLEYEITPIEKVRTRSRAIERLVGYAQQRHEDGADHWCVAHVQDPEAAAHLVETCKPIFGRDPLFVSALGPVIGAHVGPGVLGVGGILSSDFEGGAP